MGSAARCRGSAPVTTRRASRFLPEVAFSRDLKIIDAAGGLHVTIATDNNGHVWEWGDAESNPALAKSNVPVQITPDSEGNEFTLSDGAGHNVLSMAASVSTSIAVKGDGTVWIWDDCSGGLQGDGTEGSATVTHPIKVKIPLAAGVKITKVVVSSIAVALASDGSVWTWGGKGVIEDLGTNNADYKTPHQLTKTSTGAAMPPIVDIATGQSYSYALAADGSLYTWGLYAEIAGMCPGSGWCPAPLPALSTHVVLGKDGGGGAHITSIYANTGASYAILSDGTLWAWGSNGQGLVGNGVAPDYSATTPPYTWDWSKDSMLVTQAVHIATDVHNFTKVFTGPAFVFYAYAMTSDGRLFSWGRNKTANLGSGVYPMNSQQAATYPNSWDVTVPTEVSPHDGSQQADLVAPVHQPPGDGALLVRRRAGRSAELLRACLNGVCAAPSPPRSPSPEGRGEDPRGSEPSPARERGWGEGSEPGAC